MSLILRVPLLTIAIAAVLSALTGATASADGGVCGLPDGRPACTILRPLAVHATRERMSVGWEQECIVVVGGLGSPTDGSDAGFFREALGEVGDDPHFQLIRFGVDEGLYDTTGGISRSGAALRQVIRRNASACDAIHLLAHSMGGAVVDRALSKLEPADLGIATYIAMSSPHNGANGARAVRPALEASPTVAAAASAAADLVNFHDPTKDAVRDLARIAAPRPTRDVAAVRLRLVTDPIVLRRDNYDRRVDVREYPAESVDQVRDGHGGIVRNALAQQILRETIVTHRTPPDTRSPSEITAAADASERADRVIGGIEAVAGAALLGAARVTNIVAPVTEAALPPVR